MNGNWECSWLDFVTLDGFFRIFLVFFPRLKQKFTAHEISRPPEEISAQEISRPGEKVEDHEFFNA